jgi:lysophospholipid acyltransferase (LPLAT)-like uncharacterized protein
MAGVFLRRISLAGSLCVASGEAELDRQESCGALSVALLRDVGRGHVIVPFWSSDQMTIALLAAERHGLRPALSEFEIVADDSMGGEIMWQIGRKFGLRMRRLHTRGNPQRLEDLANWMRNPKPFFIAVDGGSEYGTVPSGLIRLAARLGSTLWPVAIQASRRLKIPGLIADIPLPGANLGLGIASSLRLERKASIVDMNQELKKRLDLASALARSCIGRESSPRVRTKASST